MGRTCGWEMLTIRSSTRCCLFSYIASCCR
jgi:hypothetical protein